MIIKKTFADIIVAVRAPKCRNAALPLNIWQYNHENETNRTKNQTNSTSRSWFKLTEISGTL